jgi:glycosyltransferase involved in cell wall biosynthesis
MRVVYILDGLFMGGAETNTLCLMQAMQQEGVDTLLYTLCDHRDGVLANDAQEAGIKRINLGMNRFYDLAAAARFLSLLRRDRPDLVHIQDPYANILGLLARYVLGIPVITTRHVLADTTATGRDHVRAAILNGSARLAAARVIAVAGPIAALYAEQSGISTDRVSVVHNGIAEPRSIAAEREAIRARLGWDQHEKVILMVAVMRDGKGHEDLLEALPSIREAVDGARIIFAGDGPLRASLETIAKPYGDDVCFLGERNDVAELMAAADLLALPSYSEALPTVLLEAAAAGLPAVASAVGGVSEIIENGQSGYFVPPGDRHSLAEAIIDILANPALSARMGAFARHLARERFTVAHQARNTLIVYRQVLDKAGRPGARTTGSHSASEAHPS